MHSTCVEAERSGSSPTDSFAGCLWGLCREMRKREIIKNQSLHKAMPGLSYDFSRTLEQLGSLSNDKDEDDSDLLNLSNVGVFSLS